MIIFFIIKHYILERIQNMSIYLDTSRKDGSGVTARRHWIWRLDMYVEGKRFRMRSKNYNHLVRIQENIRNSGMTYEEAKKLKGE